MSWSREDSLLLVPQSHLSAMGYLGQLAFLIFLFLDLTFLLPHITWAYQPIGIQLSHRSLVARHCLPVHTPILGKLDRQSVSTRPWPKFNTSDFLSTSAGLCEKKKGGRERESIFMNKIWIWLSSESKFITTHTRKFVYIYKIIYIYICKF